MRRRIAAVIIFLILFVLTWRIADGVVRAKFINDSTTIVKGFFAEKKNSIDVLVMGSSNSFCTIDPVVMYENYGIAAYDFGSSSQPLNISLLYLKEAFKTQSPKVVVLEANMIPQETIYSKQENRLRWGLTDMPLSVDKLRCIYQAVGKIDEEFMSYVFPVLRYHGRWREVSKTDYTYWCSDKTNYAKGYLVTQEVTPEAVNLADYEAQGESWISDDVRECFDEIYSLCCKNDTKLVLFKSPRQGWYSYHTAIIEELAYQKGIPYLDYNELVQELQLDTLADFRDTEHLNDNGARKVSMHMGEYLAAHYELPDRREDEKENSWDEALKYRKRQEPQPFTEAQDINSCMDMLLQEEDYIVVLTYAGSQDGRGRNATEYQWIYQDGKMIFQKEWLDNGSAHKWVDGKDIVLIKNPGFYQVMIENVDYYQPGSTWSVVVYDTFTDKAAAVLGYDN